MTYLIVSGPPGSGKSSLARELAQHLGWPMISKDDIKERLADTLGLGGEDWSHKLSDAALAVLFAVAQCCPDVILEANFRPEIEGPRVAGLPGSKLQIFCQAPTDELIARVEDRAESGDRHPIHEDAMDPEDRAVALRREIERAEPLPSVGPTLEIDTSRKINIEQVAAWVSARKAEGASAAQNARQHGRRGPSL